MEFASEILRTFRFDEAHSHLICDLGTPLFSEPQTGGKIMYSVLDLTAYDLAIWARVHLLDPMRRTVNERCLVVSDILQTTDNERWIKVEHENRYYILSVTEPALGLNERPPLCAGTIRVAVEMHVINACGAASDGSVSPPTRLVTLLDEPLVDVRSSMSEIDILIAAGMIERQHDIDESPENMASGTPATCITDYQLMDAFLNPLAIAFQVTVYHIDALADVRVFEDNAAAAANNTDDAEQTGDAAAAAALLGSPPRSDIRRERRCILNRLSFGTGSTSRYVQLMSPASTLQPAQRIGDPLAYDPFYMMPEWPDVATRHEQIKILFALAAEHWDASQGQLIGCLVDVQQDAVRRYVPAVLARMTAWIDFLECGGGGEVSVSPTGLGVMRLVLDAFRDTLQRSRHLVGV